MAAKKESKEKPADQVAAEERAAALGNTPVEERGVDGTAPVISYDGD